MYTIFYALGIIALLNLIFWKVKKGHEFMIEKITKIGQFNVRVGIEPAYNRDFAFTFYCLPRKYCTFQLALWAVYSGFSWYRESVQEMRSI